MMFRVGQKVVCIDAGDSSTSSRWGAESEVFEGKIYTVRDLGVSRLGRPGLRLNEVTLSSSPGAVGWFTQQPFKDAFYRASRFRPVVETSIEVFQKMLNPSPEKVLENIMFDTLADVIRAADSNKTKTRVEPEVHIGFDPPQS